jgi:hypothetical protein
VARTLIAEVLSEMLEPENPCARASIIMAPKIMAPKDDREKIAFCIVPVNYQPRRVNLIGCSDGNSVRFTERCVPRIRY